MGIMCPNREQRDPVVLPRGGNDIYMREREAERGRERESEQVVTVTVC